LEGRGDCAGHPPRGASRAAAVDQRRVLLGRRAPGHRAAESILLADVRRVAGRRLERSRARTGGPQPHNPAAIGIHRTGAAEASATRRTGLSLSRLDRRAWRNLGAAGAAWFLLIAFALTGWFVVIVPLRADILDNDMTLIYIGVRIGVEHGWSHIYSLPLQHDLFAQLRPHAVFNDGERFLSPPPFGWLIL